MVGMKAVLLSRNERLGVNGSSVRFEANRVEEILRNKNSGRVSDSEAMRKINATSLFWLALDGRRIVVGLYGNACALAIAMRITDVQRTENKCVLMLNLRMGEEGTDMLAEAKLFFDADHIIIASEIINISN